MGLSVNLGSLFADVKLDLKGLRVDAKTAESIFRQLAGVQKETAKLAAAQAMAATKAQTTQAIADAKKQMAAAMQKSAADRAATAITQKQTAAINQQVASIKAAAANNQNWARVTVSANNATTQSIKDATAKTNLQATAIRSTIAATNLQTSANKANIATQNTASTAIKLQIASVNQLTAAQRAQAQQATASAKVQIAQINAAAKAQAAAAHQASQSGWHKAELAHRIGGSMLHGGTALAAIVGGAVKEGSDFQSVLAEKAANTNMTPIEFTAMETTVKKFMTMSSAPMEDLAQAYMHIANYGYRATDAVNIFNEANKAAISTGGHSAENAQLLAKAMREFNLPTSQAKNMMNMLHTAAARGDMTLPQFVHSVGPAFAQAAAIGMKPDEIAAAMSALTRHGFDASSSATQIRGMISKIINPPQAGFKMLEKLQTFMVKEHGFKGNLLRDFTATGLKEKGLSGVIEDMRLVAQKTKIPMPELMKTIINAQRGGIGFGALAGVGHHDFQEIRKETAGNMKGQGDPVGQAFARTSGTLKVQLGQLRNQFALLGMEMAKTLMPTIQAMTARITQLVKWFIALPDPVKRTLTMFIALAAPIMLVSGAILKMVSSVLMIRYLNGGVGVLGLLKNAFLALISPIRAFLLFFAGLSAPVLLTIAVVTAAVTGLVLAWKNNWFNIRDHAAAAWNAIRSLAVAIWTPLAKFLRDIWPPIKDVVVYVWGGIKSAITVAANFLKGFLDGICKAWDFVFKDTWEGILLTIRGVWQAISGAAKVIWGVVAGIITVFLDLITGRWKEAWDGIKHYATMVWEGIKDFFSGILKAIVGVVAAGLQVVTNLWNGFWDGVKAIGEKVIDAVVGAWEWMWNKINTGAQTGAQTVLGIMDVFTGNTSRALQRLGGTAQESGAAIPRGMAQGVQQNSGFLIEAIRRMAQQGDDHLPHSDAKKGPFSRLRAAGIAIPATLSDGIEKGTHHLSAAMRKMAAEAKKHLNQMLKAARQAAGENAQIISDLFHETHGEKQNKTYDVVEAYVKNIARGGDPTTARTLMKERLKNLQKEIDAAAQEAQDKLSEMMDGNKFVKMRRDAKRDYQDGLAEGLIDPKVLLGIYDQTIDQIRKQEEEASQATAEKVQLHIGEIEKGMNQLYDKSLDKAKKAEEARVQALKQMADVFESIEQGQADLNAKIKGREEDIHRFKYETGMEDAESYKKFLQDKLKSLQEFSDEWMRLYREMYNIQVKEQKQADKEVEKEQKVEAKRIRKHAEAIQNVFEEAFHELFTKGFKGFFDSVTHGFGKLIEDIIAKWAASKITKLVGGALDSLFDNVLGGLFGKGGGEQGGGFGGGTPPIAGGGGKPKIMGSIGATVGTVFGGPIGGLIGGLLGGLFNFDDAGNDANARRWGFDFLNQFSQGAERAQHTRAGNRQIRNGLPVVNPSSNNGDLHVHIGTFNHHGPQDVRMLVGQIAWQAQQELRARVGSGGRG